MSSKNYFDTVASDWDRIRQSLFSTDLRSKALSAVPLREGVVAADLGAGTGFLTRGLLDRGVRVIAVDQSEAMLSELRTKTGPAERLETRVGEAEKLPLEDRSVDLVFANMFLHHVENPGVAIREMARILAPGGRVVLTDLDAHEHEFLRTEQHDRWLGFHRDDVEGWLRDAGFQETEIRDAEESCCSTSSCGEE
ncbi:MAG: class I SAM-dependent methyltransferase, partial [Thermoanaerobaculia bacterium]|nr:class I SAM-dependent methyltransferase [Thermoanaerobaculia bacterium]